MTKLLQSIVAGVALALVAIYGILSLIVTGPINPIKVSIGPKISELYDPYLLQNWQLFSPEPLSQERGILVQAQCRNGKQTQFLDITSPLLAELQSTRLFASREARIVDNGVGRRFEMDEVLQRVIVKNPSLEKNDRAAKQAKVENEQNVRASESLLVAYGRRKLDPSVCGGEIKAVRVRYVLHDYPGWSHRRDWNMKGHITTIDTDWFNV